MITPELAQSVAHVGLDMPSRRLVEPGDGPHELVPGADALTQGSERGAVQPSFLDAEQCAYGNDEGQYIEEERRYWPRLKQQAAKRSAGQHHHVRPGLDAHQCGRSLLLPDEGSDIASFGQRGEDLESLLHDGGEHE